eukprot:UN01139
MLFSVHTLRLVHASTQLFLTGNSKWIDFVGTQNQVSLLINCLLFSIWI